MKVEGKQSGHVAKGSTEERVSVGWIIDPLSLKHPMQ